MQIGFKLSAEGQLEDARVFDLLNVLPLIAVAVSGEASVQLAAGLCRDGR